MTKYQNPKTFRYFPPEADQPQAENFGFLPAGRQVFRI